MHAKLREVEVAALRAFSGGRASEDDLLWLSGLLAAVTLDDLGLGDELATLTAAPNSGTPWIERVVISRPEFHASVFLVPVKAELPLHDHPEMTVLLRPLAGRLSIAAFDRVAEEPDGSLLVRSRGWREVCPDDPCDVLTPECGNLHRIRACEAAAFLDLFSPYYDEHDGRPCGYYREDGEIERAGERLVRLVPAPELDPEAAAVTASVGSSFR